MAGILNKITTDAVVVNENQTVFFEGMQINTSGTLYSNHFNFSFNVLRRDVDVNEKTLPNLAFYFSGKYTDGAPDEDITIVLPLSVSAKKSTTGDLTLTLTYSSVGNKANNLTARGKLIAVDMSSGFPK